MAQYLLDIGGTRATPSSLTSKTTSLDSANVVRVATAGRLGGGCVRRLRLSVLRRWSRRGSIVCAWLVSAMVLRADWPGDRPGHIETIEALGIPAPMPSSTTSSDGRRGGELGCGGRRHRKQQLGARPRRPREARQRAAARRRYAGGGDRRQGRRGGGACLDDARSACAASRCLRCARWGRPVWRICWRACISHATRSLRTLLLWSSGGGCRRWRRVGDHPLSRARAPGPGHRRDPAVGDRSPDFRCRPDWQPLERSLLTDVIVRRFTPLLRVRGSSHRATCGRRSDARDGAGGRRLSSAARGLILRRRK